MSDQASPVDEDATDPSPPLQYNSDDTTTLQNGRDDHPPPYETLDNGNAPPPPYSPSFLSTSRIFDIPEAPPDYFSVVSTRIQEARRESDGCCSFLMKAMQTLLCTTGLVILLIILMSVPVTMFGVGTAYFGQCPIEQLIPIYLIIAGIFGVLKSIETLIKHFIVCIKCSCLQRVRRHSKLKYLFIVWRVFDLIFNLILLGWMIAGSYWIFRNYSTLQETGFSETDCQPVLYKFAFGVTVSSYIVMALTCCCVCGCSLCRNAPSPPPSEGERRERRRPLEGRGDENEVDLPQEDDDNVERIEMQTINSEPSNIRVTNQLYFNELNSSSPTLS